MFTFELVVHFDLIFVKCRMFILFGASPLMCVILVITTVSLLSDLYVYAVLVCCIGILSVLLFTLTIVWQSVFSKRKSRGKRTESSCLEWEHS